MSSTPYQRLIATRWQIRIALLLTLAAVAAAGWDCQGWRWWLVVGVLTAHAVFCVMMSQKLDDELREISSPPAGPIRLAGVVMRDV